MQSREIEWLWDQRLALGKLAMFDGKYVIARTCSVGTMGTKPKRVPIVPIGR